MAPADKRRADLVVPYRHGPPKAVSKAPSMFSSTLPLAAMFMKNKIMSWAALFTAIQLYLNEPKVRAPDAQPASISIVTAIVGLLTCYSDFVLPRRVLPFGQPPKTDAVVEDITE